MNGIYKSIAGEREIRERYSRILSRWPVPCEHLRLPTREGETFVVACGPANAPPLLLFHGSGANSAMWMGDAATWSQHFRLFAVDMIGEPGLSAPARPPLASESHALWLDDVMQGLSLARASMAGVSLGGWLALDYATRRPHRIDRIVVLCPGGVGRQKNGILFKAIFLQMFGEWGRKKALEAALGPAPAGAAINPEFAKFVFLIQKHFRPRRVKIPQFSDESLKRLQMPVLAIVGGRDAMLDSFDTKRRLERCVPHASVCLLPDAGHLLREQTTRVLEFLLDSRTIPRHADQVL